MANEAIILDQLREAEDFLRSHQYQNYLSFSTIPCLSFLPLFYYGWLELPKKIDQLETILYNLDYITHLADTPYSSRAQELANILRTQYFYLFPSKKRTFRNQEERIIPYQMTLLA